MKTTHEILEKLREERDIANSAFNNCIENKDYSNGYVYDKILTKLIGIIAWVESDTYKESEELE